MKSRFTALMGALISQYGKWLVVVTYPFTALLFWNNRHNLYIHIPMYRRTDAAYLFTDFLLVVVAITLFIRLVRFTYRLKTPLFLGRRFQRAVERIGLRNSLGEYPRLHSVRNDQAKRFGLIWEVENMGVTVSDFERYAEELETVCNFRIDRIELCKRSTRTRLYITPRKHVKPTIILPNDERLGTMEIGELINCLVVGATGTGKTVAIKTLISKIAKQQPTAKIWVLDFKHHDFREFSDCPNHYGYSDCVQGLTDFYNAFKEQQNTGAAGCPQYLIFDEWGSFILSQDKKQAEQCKAQLAELLMLGRSYRFVPIIGIQRADASFFLSGARDQFRSILLLGNISKEQKNMLLPDFKDSLTDNNGLGEGYLFLDGKGVVRTKIVVQDLAALNDTIREAMCR